jgi:exoribonuclease R
MKLYVGIICTFNTLKYGVSKTGKTIFKCIPFDHQIGPVKIVYGGKLKGKVVIVFTLPGGEKKQDLGEIYHVIGLAEPSNLINALMYHHQVYRKPFKQIICNTTEMESKICRFDYTKLKVFSIDPKGCIDIDDAFSLQQQGNNFIVGVHIAQPIYWLTRQTMIERVQNAFSTLYLGRSEMLPLWSNEIQEKSSLLQGQKRAAYSLFFHYKDNHCTNVTHTPSWIINSCPTHYEDIENSLVREFLDWTNRVSQQKLDTHELVSYWMMKTNQYIGSQFDLPYRVQEESGQFTMHGIDPCVESVFKYYTMEKATYSISKQKHASLNCQKYVHFTSPIRRIIDCLIHWQITYKDDLQIDIDRINELDQATKKFHRSLEMHKNIKEIEEGEITGYLYEKITKGTWRLYFPQLGFFKIRVVDTKLEHLIDDVLTENYILGQGYPFVLHKKEGFLPQERLIIVPNFSLLLQ